MNLRILVLSTKPSLLVFCRVRARFELISNAHAAVARSTVSPRRGLMLFVEDTVPLCIRATLVLSCMVVKERSEQEASTFIASLALFIIRLFVEKLCADIKTYVTQWILYFYTCGNLGNNCVCVLDIPIAFFFW